MASATTGTTDLVWRERDTTAGDIETAVRMLLGEAHAANQSYVPGRVLNLVCVVDKEYSGEIANRLRGVGRFHPSRTVVCAVSARQQTLDAVATIAAPSQTVEGEHTATRETIIVDIGPQHLPHLDRIVDPLVVTDLPTLVWSPHGHDEAVDSLLELSQVVLLDSVDEPDARDALRRAGELADGGVYVVDLAWLRSTPWRERIAATFDPEHLRPELRMISAVTVRHHPDSGVAALLLLGWMGARLGWQVSPLAPRGDGVHVGSSHTRRQDVGLRTEADPSLQVRGLAGLVLETASGRHLELDRGPGGLRARYRNSGKDVDREWTIMGASRGEAGILGEGIRQALLRDPVYRPSLACAAQLAG